jgi:hypothetical protein
LCKSYEGGAERFMIQEDSINVVYGGFISKWKIHRWKMIELVGS